METVLNKYSNAKKVFTSIGLLIFPFVLPLPLPINIKSIAFIVFLATLLFNISPKNIDLNKILSNRIVVLFVILYLLDPILSVYRGDGYYVRDLRISFLIAPILFLASTNILELFRSKILIAFMAGVLGYIAFSAGYLIYFFNIEAKYEIFTIGYYLKYITYHYMPFAIHHTYMGIYICFATSIIIFNMGLRNNLKIILCLILFASIFIIASKLTALFFLLILGVFALRVFKISILKATLFLTFILTSISIMFFFLFLTTDLFRTIDDSISIRKNLIYCTLDGISSNFIFGIGNKNVKDFLWSCNNEIGFMDTHNIFLQELLSNGIVAIALLVIIFYTFSKTFFKSKSILGIVLIMSILVFGLVEHVFSLQNGILFFIPFLLLFYSTYDLSTKKLKTDG